MEKQMENEMETREYIGIFRGYIGAILGPPKSSCTITNSVPLTL